MIKKTLEAYWYRNLTNLDIFRTSILELNIKSEQFKYPLVNEL